MEIAAASSTKVWMMRSRSKEIRPACMRTWRCSSPIPSWLQVARARRILTPVTAGSKSADAAAAEAERLAERHPDWKGLRSIAAVTARRIDKKTGAKAARPAIHHVPRPGPEGHSAATRAHWSVRELSWTLGRDLRRRPMPNQRRRLGARTSPSSDDNGYNILQRRQSTRLLRETPQSLHRLHLPNKPLRRLRFRTLPFFKHFIGNDGAVRALEPGGRNPRVQTARPRARRTFRLSLSRNAFIGLAHAYADWFRRVSPRSRHDPRHLPRRRRARLRARNPGFDIAKSISPSLAKRTVAVVRDGEVVDLADPVDGTRSSSSSRATIRARSSSSATTPRMCWPRRCSRCGRARRSPSAR